jgi:hypothetical protein
MKKLIASLLVLVFGATMVMAEDIYVQVPAYSVVASNSIENLNLENEQNTDLFNVSGIELNESEAAIVKGEAVWMVVVIAAVLITVVAVKAY